MKPNNAMERSRILSRIVLAHAPRQVSVSLILGVRQKIMSGNRNAPLVESSTLMAAARDLFPCASVTFTEVNPQHKSWRIEIRIEAAVWLELFWGPLSGFGATDLYNQKPEGGGLFDPYDVSLDSVGAAIKWLNEKSRNQN